ncbi:MAG: membrane protein insertion efficiency factor YidD [Candidatus Kryptonium sp.]
MKRDILTQFAILLVKIYKFFISPIFPPSCRFYPSCSEYSIQALSKYGFFKGSWLSIKRIIRCNPFNPGGIDEVP